MRSLRILCSGLLAGIALAAVGPSLAITGGQSVAEALAAGEKDDGAAALASIARDVAR